MRRFLAKLYVPQSYISCKLRRMPSRSLVQGRPAFLCLPFETPTERMRGAGLFLSTGFVITYTYAMKHVIRVGVLRGGPSNEYEVSLASGAKVLEALRLHFEHPYDIEDIFIDKQGVWHMDGVPIKPEDAMRKVDVVFNALHGTYGEDGKVQGFLETHGMPFTGSGSLPSSVGMNKVLTKKIFKDHGIKTPYFRELQSDAINNDTEKLVKELFHSLVLPAVVKPTSSGSSVGVTVVKVYKDLGQALADAALHSDSVLIEEFIPGIEATGGVLEGFRGQDIYSLPPVEIRPHNGFFDYSSKYKGQSTEIVPATFSHEIKKEIEELSARIHRIMGLRHYSRSDFIIHPRRGVFALEVNTLPGLTEESLVPKALRAVGSDMTEFVHHLIRLALEG